VIRDQASSPSMSRRRLFTAGGVGLAIGAVGVAMENSTVEASTPSSAPDPPDVDLMQEHGVLKRVLLIYQECLRRLSIGEQLPASAVYVSAEIIHDFIEGFHEPLEEGYVFPKLRSAGKLVGTIDTLLLQHARGRQLTQLILATSSTPAALVSGSARVIEAMSAFVRMYQPHEAREDTVVFPMLRSSLTSPQLSRLGSVFADLQRQQFGREGFSDIVARVQAIEERLGIYDLNQFTPSSSTAIS
jgi:hemerythrin-like domain-containing protein